MTRYTDEAKSHLAASQLRDLSTLPMIDLGRFCTDLEDIGLVETP